jgi:two-component system chemotaxis response regulator CheB
VAELGGLIVRMVVEPAGATPSIPLDARPEAAIAAQELADMTTEDRLGTASRFTGPACQGALGEIDDGGMLRYRCHVGHAHTGEAVLAAQSAAEVMRRLMHEWTDEAETVETPGNDAS